MDNVLKVALRSKTGKIAARSARRTGMVPAVVYAHGEATRELLVNDRDFSRMLDAIKGKSSLIDVQVGDEAPIKCIIKQIQRNAITLGLLHVDFQKVHAHEKVTLNVPIHLAGTPIGLKMGGLLDHALREAPVRGLPEKLPASIGLDITNLKLGQSLHVSDIKVEGVEVLLPPTTPVASVLVPKKVEEVTAAPVAEAVEGEEPKEPVVISEKKAADRAEERAKAEAEEKGGKPRAEKKEEKKTEKKKEEKKK
jgi:large subunit ribosomal protein L25